jgi:ankyrin repeat protein
MASSYIGSQTILVSKQNIISDNTFTTISVADISDDLHLLHHFFIYILDRDNLNPKWSKILEETLLFADPNYVCDDKATPLMFAAKYGHLDAFQLLLGKGAKIVDDEHKIIKNEDNLTILMYAVIGKNCRIVQLIVDTLRKILSPAEFNTYINEKDNSGMTALEYAFLNGKSMVEFIYY